MCIIEATSRPRPASGADGSPSPGLWRLSLLIIDRARALAHVYHGPPGLLQDLHVRADFLSHAVEAQQQHGCSVWPTSSRSWTVCGTPTLSFAPRRQTTTSPLRSHTRAASACSTSASPPGARWENAATASWAGQKHWANPPPIHAFGEAVWAQCRSCEPPARRARF